MNFISFCGIDGSGKSTIIRELQLKLELDRFARLKTYRNYYFTKEPRLFKNRLIKKIIVPSKLNFVFFFIDRIFHKIKLIKYKNKLILSDRSIVCGVAYAYAVSKFNLFFHKLYCNKKWLIPFPKLVFYIIPKFKSKDRDFKTEFSMKVKKGYEKIVPLYFNNQIKIIPIYNKKDRLHESVDKIYLIIKKWL